MYWIAAWLMIFQLITQLTMNAQNTCAQEPLYFGQKRENIQLQHVLSNLHFFSVYARLNTPSLCACTYGAFSNGQMQFSSVWMDYAAATVLCDTKVHIVSTGAQVG